MKPAHAHLTNGDGKQGLLKAPSLKGFRKLMCVRVQGGRKRD
jgi:hypothetical protein